MQCAITAIVETTSEAIKAAPLTTTRGVLPGVLTGPSDVTGLPSVGGSGVAPVIGVMSKGALAGAFVGAPMGALLGATTSSVIVKVN